MKEHLNIINNIFSSIDKMPVKMKYLILGALLTLFANDIYYKLLENRIKRKSLYKIYGILQMMYVQIRSIRDNLYKKVSFSKTSLDFLKQVRRLNETMLNECLILIDIKHNKSKYHLSIFQTVLTLQTLNNTLKDLYFKLEIVNEGTASFNLFYPDGFQQSAKLARLLKKLDIPKTTFHGLRDTHASFLFSNDSIRLDYISQRLGHSNLQTTMNYYLELMPEKNICKIQMH